ncbi:YjbF family lipoprotein [Vibrio methylphosphonaticus]|uniref:YjbF family lipoprotein n=1 Tax=Vibrio methylphosphonaticus TaxID=2946866 RepID=UPI00202A02BC|nr:YjbF family lipoprotein [Vibrio methylphosphonaticus]MCL9775451.1 YjbF family lipoprotein [Vibrio methylphosphonaticus]
MNFKPYLLACAVLFLTACSQRFQDVNATMAEALFGADDAALTAENIRKLPYASAYVRINEGPQIFMVLAFAEPNTQNGIMQYKWISSDRAVIITESGRIVKTIGLYGDNLASISRQQQTDTSWQVTYDWMPKYRYGYKGIALQTNRGSETVTTDLSTYNTQKLTETVTFDAIDGKLVNTYWKDIKTNNVIKSIEQLGPEMTTVEMTLLKVPTI